MAGRAPTCDIVIPMASVSGCHLSVAADDAGILVRDLGSINRTFINGMRMEEPTLAHNGDEIQVGEPVITAFPEDVPVEADDPTPTVIELGPAPVHGFEHGVHAAGSDAPLQPVMG
jgi:pSer/pThr/pTyr-binding forkhead associated (FHA) protein